MALRRSACFLVLVLVCLATIVHLQTDSFRNGYKHLFQSDRSSTQNEYLPSTHSVLRSVSITNGKYISIDLAGEHALNPNIIPHPFLEETWIVVAQLRQETQHFAELVCNARFVGEGLECAHPPTRLPIESTRGDECTGDLAYFNLNEGPHDARVFYGPTKPYIVYGSNSAYTCFGQWVHDFRQLVEWGYDDANVSSDEFHIATELQRPAPWNAIEKNWFLFWDIDGQMYVHNDLVPGRVFAKIEGSGLVGPDLGPLTRHHDEACMAKYMPVLGLELESIHQATNSLSVTMCRRDDVECVPDPSNTYVFTIFQHKKYFNFHATYEPYILILEQSPPFRIHAISKKPFWIYGRTVPSTKQAGADSLHSATENLQTAEEGEEMFYVTSMSWKASDQKYHGYIDDVLFLAFGIEDKATAAIDTTAQDLMQHLGYC